MSSFIPAQFPGRYVELEPVDDHGHNANKEHNKKLTELVEPDTAIYVKNEGSPKSMDVRKK